MKLRSVLILVALCELFVTFGFFPPTSAEEVAPRSIALVGGTLIDGTGTMPVPDAVVIVKGDLIAAVGTSSTIRIPEGTEIVKFAGQLSCPVSSTPTFIRLMTSGY